MKLGAFSVSLSVKDLEASKTFYEKLGFETSGGNIKNNYLVMKNGEHLIGLYQGMFDGNILTFNPGWDQHKGELESFDDVRDIQKSLKQVNIEFTTEADEDSKGPAHFIINDPDGNVIMLDQHV